MYHSAPIIALKRFLERCALRWKGAPSAGEMPLADHQEQAAKEDEELLHCQFYVQMHIRRWEQNSLDVINWKAEEEELQLTHILYDGPR